MTTNEKIIEKIKLIHGDKYSLDKFVYSSYKEKVTLICKTHGEFSISLSNLISNKRGCPTCGKLKSKNSNRSNTEEFISKANKVHNFKYRYDNVNYYNWKEKVSIICEKHGEFKQSPFNHLSGSGCPKCNKGRPPMKKNIEKKGIDDKISYKLKKFIEISNKVHNNKYDYSNVIYYSSNKKVKIICKKHGEFEQTPSHHKRGNGCPSCSYENSFGPRIKTSDFISISKNRHQGYYSYNKSIYLGNKEKIIITCPIHGDFKQLPKYHMNGGGCPKCNIGKHGRGGGKGNKKLKYTTDEFIKICNNLHNNKYDYSESKYNGSKSKIKVNCLKHGTFDVLAYNHMNGVGCFFCSIDDKKRTKEELINELNIIHNNKYKYIFSNDFISTKDDIKIVCPTHGEFFQNVEVHLRGSGCTLCKTKSRGEILIKNILNKYNIDFTKEKKFDNLSRFRFDFWIPKLNTVIEFDGKHHFKSIPFFGGKKTFKKIKKNDLIKNTYCLKNNINLLRISYSDLKNIEEIIKKQIIENVKLQT
jgi:very-short-patch-repair endonuclease